MGVVRRGRSLRAVLAGSLVFGVVTVGSVVGAEATTPTAVSLYVTTAGSGTTCSHASPCGSVQNAITTATGGSYNNSDNVTVHVAASPSAYTETDIINALALNSLTIAGARASTTTVNGNKAGTVFTVNGGMVTLSGLTITNGDGSVGGGIGNEGATLNLTNDTITGNTTNRVFPNNGAGIDNGDNGGSGTVTVSHQQRHHGQHDQRRWRWHRQR